MSQRYPTPDIQLFLARIEDSLRPIFSPAQLKKYQAAVNAVFFESPPLDVAGKALQKIEADHPESDNWHSSFFSDVYGGVRSPVASVNRLSLRLKPPVPHASGDPQAYSAARYLRAIGIWTIHLRDGDPGSETDKLYSLPVPDDVNATVFYHGVPHLVRIATSRVALSVEAISAQLTDIRAKKFSSDILPIAAYSWRLGRTEWHRVHQQLLGVDENRSLFDLLKTSAVSVAFEDESPATTPEFMNDVREGTYSGNRYSDQTLTLVVYKNGEVGLAVDHAPADCGALIELATTLGTVLRADRFPQ
ncbi:CoA-dependent acyltransferase [Thelephora ganbajun]|uniref:CoA-dependent acyltransferase n=1 Tax=Thelephora ganbajun TaxID=370292 RepID=A0ACB6ZUU5_THEGA|nr:CoA-dependent acyltransferase [Thelephora ganbajun]